MVRQDPVHLLGHPAVKAPEPRLDVRHRHVHLRRRERSREGRVRVPVDQDDLRLLFSDHLLDCSEHPAGLDAVAPRTDIEVVVGYWDPEVPEEDLGEPVVVVLAGVDEDLLVHLPELPRDGSALDELGPGPDDREDLHAARLREIASQTRTFPSPCSGVTVKGLPSRAARMNVESSIFKGSTLFTRSFSMMFSWR